MWPPSMTSSADDADDEGASPHNPRYRMLLKDIVVSDNPLH